MERVFMEEKTPDNKYGYSIEDADSIIYAIDIVGDAYNKGFINWNIFEKAMEKIRTNLNGSWMFEQKEEK